MRIFYCLFMFIIPTALSFDDPSYQELDMFDWTSGLRVAYCLDVPIPDLIVPFRRTIAKVVTKFCQNTTACNLRKPLVFIASLLVMKVISSVIFKPEQIAMLDGFPRREYGSIHIKYYIILPHSSEVLLELVEQLLLLAMMTKHIGEVATRLGWTIISYEKYPRYDSMTEFMNIAIIPIVLFSLPLMIFLAYWTSTLRPNVASEAWLVTGEAGGKNAALRRTMEIIAEQNAEIDRQHRLELTKNMLITGGNQGVTTGGELLLNVARLSMASTQPKSPTSTTMSPNIIVSPSDSVRSLSTVGPLPTPSAPTHLTVTRHKRRQSSVEDIKQARRARGIYPPSGQKRWKSGSIMLGAFSSRQQ